MFEVPNNATPSQIEETVITGKLNAMIFLFSPDCQECRNYASYATNIAEGKGPSNLSVYSLDESKFPEFRKKYVMEQDSNFLFFRDGVRFDECPLNRRGVGIILCEMLFKP